MQLVQGWRNDGYTRDQVEVWTVGYPGSEAWVDSFAGSATESLFVDSASMTAYSAFNATKDDLIIIDRQGSVAHDVSLASMPLTSPTNRDQIDAWVRALLP